MDKYFFTGDISNHGDLDSLLRARDWIFDKFSIGGGEQTGLNLRYDTVGLVPGNHDAWNADSSGPLLDRRQKSLANFNHAFDRHQMAADPGCKYEWLEKDGHGVFVLYLDTCILGDHARQGEPAIRIPFATQIARGRVAIGQSEELLAWVDEGRAGLLKNPTTNTLIDATSFQHALKIIVTHHYLIEPAGRKSDYFMSVEDGRMVFRNIAYGDFDLLLCGHKHLADMSPQAYGDQLDRRAKHRYLMNCFRREAGLTSLPAQLEARRGRRWTRLFSTFIGLATKAMKNRRRQAGVVATDPSALADELCDILQLALQDRQKFKASATSFAEKHRALGVIETDRREIIEIGNRVRRRFSHTQQMELQAVLRSIVGLCASLDSRPFVQLMSGSSAKNAPDLSGRAMNTYEVEGSILGWNLKMTSHRYNEQSKQFEPGLTKSQFFPRVR